jgi:hypothetical protein
MTEQGDRETYGGQEVDAEDQLQPEDTLVDRGSEDVLDEGYSPPERRPSTHDIGTTLEEERAGETLDQRLAQEEPEVDEPLEPADPRAGRLVAPDEGFGEDIEKDEVAEDVGIDGGAASAEEAAVHVISDDDETDLR